MDARQESYATAPSALMAPGRYTPAPDADLLPRMTQRFYHSHFCALYTHFLSLTHNGDSWIYSTISSLALCCAEQSILQQAGLLYRVLQRLQMRDRQAIEWVEPGSQILHTHTYRRYSRRGLLVVRGNENVTFIHPHVFTSWTSL